MFGQLRHRDQRIIAGDSTGSVTVWDAKTDTQLQSFRAHKSDVLALSMASVRCQCLVHCCHSFRVQDGKNFYSASTDQRISQFTLLSAESGRKASWTLTTSRRVHSHDIRSLHCSPQYKLDPAPLSAAVVPLLISGGMDMSVQLTPCATNFEPIWDDVHALRLGPLSNSADLSFTSGPGRPLSYVRHSKAANLVSYAHARDLIMLRRAMGCSVWRVANDGHHSKVLNLQAKGLTSTVTGGISPDGRWIILGDLWQVKLWQLNQPCSSARHQHFDQAPDGFKIQSIKDMQALLDSTSPLNSLPYVSASCVHFTADSTRLVFASVTAPEEPIHIVVLSLPNDATPLAIAKVWQIDGQAKARHTLSNSRTRQVKGLSNGHAHTNGNGVVKTNGHHVNGHTLPTDLGKAAQQESSASEEGASDGEGDERPSGTTSNIEFAPCIVAMTSSSHGKWLIVATSHRTILIYNMLTFAVSNLNYILAMLTLA